MKLPTFRRLNKADYPAELQDTIDKLALTLNNSIELLFTSLNKNVSIQDNVRGTFKTVEIAVNTAGIPKDPVSIALDFDGTAIGTSVIRVENLTNPTIYPVSGVTITYEQNAKRINIKHITGLQAGYNYSISVFVYG